jgi:hypothetical protein
MTSDDVVSIAQVASPWLALFGVIITGLRMILSGGLVPRSQQDVLIAQWEARLAESKQREQDWRATAIASDAARELESKSLADLIIYARSADRVLSNLPAPRKDAG